MVALLPSCGEEGREGGEKGRERRRGGVEEGRERRRGGREERRRGVREELLVTIEFSGFSFFFFDFVRDRLDQLGTEELW